MSVETGQRLLFAWDSSDPDYRWGEAKQVAQVQWLSRIVPADANYFVKRAEFLETQDGSYLLRLHRYAKDPVTGSRFLCFGGEDRHAAMATPLNLPVTELPPEDIR